MPDEILWRFLVVDDRQANETEEFITGNKVLAKPNRVIIEKCANFSDALNILVRLRIDLVILDLKDDSIKLEDDSTPLAGEKVFEQIQRTRFIPVVFYTAYPEEVRHLENPYVRVVTRGEGRKLREEIQDIFSTGLPNLSKHLEEEQRMYMWENVQKYWRKPNSPVEKTELAYLLARRLANLLERNTIRRFLAGDSDKDLAAEDLTILPIEMYIYPPTNPKALAGDIVQGQIGEIKGYWIILTPSCDFQQNNANNVLLAECMDLAKQPEYEKIKIYWEAVVKNDEEKNGAPPKQEPEKVIRQLIHDNHIGQRERYKFLPGTFFVPDLLIDFQSITQVTMDQLKTLTRIASLDNPFAESCLAKFSRYYGRIGTADLNVDVVYDRLFQNWLAIRNKKT